MQFRRTKMIFAALALSALAMPVRAGDVNKFLPDDTEVVVVINVQQLLKSSVIQKHAMGPLKGVLQSNEKAKQVLDALGFDPLKDLTRVTAASSAISPDAKGTIVAEGNFDVAKFEAKAEEYAKEKSDVVKIVKEGEHKLFEVKVQGEEKPSFGALVDKNTIVFGSEKSVVAESFDRASGKKKPALKKEVVALIEKANQTQSMWLVAPGSVLVKSPLGEDENNKKKLEKVDSLSLGFTLADDFVLGVAIATKTPDAAKEIAEEVKGGLEMAKGFLSVIASQQAGLAPLVDIVGSMKVSTEGNVVTIKSEVSNETIEKGLSKKDS